MRQKDSQRGRQHLREEPCSPGKTDNGEMRSEGEKATGGGLRASRGLLFIWQMLAQVLLCARHWAGAGAEPDPDRKDLCSPGAAISWGARGVGLSCNTARPQSSCQAWPHPGQGPSGPESQGVPGHCGWMLAQVAPGSLSRDLKVTARTQELAGPVFVVSS